MPRLFELLDPEVVRRLGAAVPRGGGPSRAGLPRRRPAPTLPGPDWLAPGSLFWTPSTWYGRSWSGADRTHTDRPAAVAPSPRLPDGRILLRPGTGKATGPAGAVLRVSPQDVERTSRDAGPPLHKTTWLQLRQEARAHAADVAGMGRIGRLREAKRGEAGWP